MRTIRFIPAATVLTTAMLASFGSFAQTGTSSNMDPTGGARQNPKVTQPGVLSEGNGSVSSTSQVGKGGSAANANPTDGARQDRGSTLPQPAVHVTKEEKQAAKAKRKEEIAATGGASNPKNPPSNPYGNAATDVGTSATPTSKN